MEPSARERRRHEVLAAIAAAGTAGISGEAIAADLGCSRAAVHRHVETLRRQGTGIVGMNEGYALADGADPIVPARCAAALLPPIAGPVLWRASTGSTNDDAAAAARRGHPEGLVVGADEQTAGRGRRGRSWQGEPGRALTFSVLLRPDVPPAGAGLLPLVVAVAVAEAIGPDAGIVWPNDIVLEGRKVCGILCESSLDEAGVAWAVAGIGINVGAAPVLGDSRWEAGAVTDRPRQELLETVLARLNDRYREWLDAGASSVVAAYTARDLLAGSSLDVTIGDRTIAGSGGGIDDLGRLVLHTAAGLEAIGSGEITRVERLTD